VAIILCKIGCKKDSVKATTLPFLNSRRVLIHGIHDPLACQILPALRQQDFSIYAGVSPGYGLTGGYGVSTAAEPATALAQVARPSLGTSPDQQSALTQSSPPQASGQNSIQSIVPIFDLVEEAIACLGPFDTCLICCEPYSVADAALESMAAGIRQILILTDGVPPLDVVTILRAAQRSQSLILGPGSPGLWVPDHLLLGSLQPQLFQAGSVALLGRGGPLLAEAGQVLGQAGLGQSIVVGTGSNELVGMSLADWLLHLDGEPHTQAIVLLGQSGGEDEERAAAIVSRLTKPIVAYIAGHSLPNSEPLWQLDTVRLGPRTVASHLASSLQCGTAQQKVAALKQAKVVVAKSLGELPGLVKRAIAKRK
jgi:succinyl-CoA synthetase alpha subunit